MKNFEYVKAWSSESAVTLLRQNHNSRIMAGGTDLVAEMRLGIASPDRLVSVNTIPGLKGIRFNEREGLKIGALTTLDDIARSAVVRERYPVLFEAISASASPQLRNRATIAGNLCQDSRCWYYRGQFRCWLRGGETCYAKDGENAHEAIFGGGPCYSVHPSDPAPALIALDARTHIMGQDGERVVTLESIFQQPHIASRRLMALNADDLISEIDIPAPASGSRGKYIKAMERRVWSFALASVAVQIVFDNDRVREARIVFGGVAPKPWRMRGVEEALHNAVLNNETIERVAGLAGEGAQPLGHNAYKVPLVKGILKEALVGLRG